ncbi:MAG: hypothetical protein CMO80_18985 [Verrucomicrobiales bacterium]|nr:hypothetical protein [Verrucomicrobiales bacterium]|tara:strand:- start:589 stop:891 length:303 start_codon:yes stop_codon:yes gene_type:complete
MKIRAHLLLAILIASVAGLALGSFQMLEGKRRATLERELGMAEAYLGRLELTTDSLESFLVVLDLSFFSDHHHHQRVCCFIGKASRRSAFPTFTVSLAPT